MTGTEVALIITAIGTTLGTLLTAYGGMRIAVATKAVHKLVNQEATDAKRYRVALQQALEAAGIPLPVDQSVITDKDVNPNG